jgi:hypothetical protein
MMALQTSEWGGYLGLFASKLAVSFGRSKALEDWPW